MKKLLNAGGIALLLLTVSCGDSSNAETKDIALAREYNGAALADSIKNIAMPSDIKVAEDSTRIILQNGGPAPFVDWDKKIVKNASVRIEVKSFEEFDRYVHTSLKAYGAYIGAEERTNNTGGLENTVTIKVPVDQFDNLLNSVPTKENKIQDKTITSQDVSAEIVDIKARVEAKSKVRERYMHLLEQAKTMDDILKVEQVVNGMQEEIESADGRGKYLTHEAAYSTIKLSYYQPSGTITGTDGREGFGTRVVDAIKVGGAWVLDFFVGMLKVWPLVLLVSGFLWWLKKKSKETNKKTVVVTAQSPDQTNNIT